MLNKSIKYYEPLIRYIANQDKQVWDIDVDCYNEENIQRIIQIYRDIQNIMIKNGNSHLILVTKIMLGVWGFVPAFDNYFGNTFRNIFKGECGFRSLNVKALNCVHEFYQHNRSEIDSLSDRIFVRRFIDGRKTNITYKKAKIIDMYGFSKR